MFVMRENVLKPVQLKKLSEHKYSATSSSILEPFLQPWWNWVVSKTPIWLAPNLITITGLAVNVVTSILLCYYSPDAKQDLPRWVCFLCAFGLSVYQTLDAIDGKQARRTQTSSPLGELFDHGCDSISTVFVILAVCCSVQLGTHPGWMYFQSFSAVTIFYCSHWQTYVSGTLKFSKIDITEAQVIIVFIHLISSVFGVSFWSHKVPILDLPLKFFPLIFALFAALVAMYQNFYIIFTGGIGKNGSSVAGTSVLSPALPLLLVILPPIVIYKKSVQRIYESNPCVYIITFGLVAAKVTNKLVVAHMTKSEMVILDSSMIGPALLIGNQYFNTMFSEHIILWIALLWSICDLCMYCSQVCLEICNHLKIHLFKIPYSTTSQDYLKTAQSTSNTAKRK